MTPPSDAIAAVTHPDPYPYYASLVARHRVGRDDVLGLWVVASADAVGAVLTHDACRVRPSAEPVPAALIGSPAGAIFGRLVRMNDGARHGALKHAVSSTLAMMDGRRAEALGHTWSSALVEELSPHRDPGHITEFAARLTASVVAGLLGAPHDAIPQVARWTADFVRGIAPGASADHVERGQAAAADLLLLGRSLTSTDPGESLLAALARSASGQDAEAIIANALGFLSQSYEATTGLVGNTLLALARQPQVHRAVLADRGVLPAVVTEVVRHDAPVQNTRRFVAGDATVAGATMKAGDAILVVLAAANHDPAVNPEPARFDVARAAPRVFTFGVGPHACPGTALATTIAVAGVSALITAGLAVERLAETVAYRPSANVRIPLFGKELLP